MFDFPNATNLFNIAWKKVIKNFHDFIQNINNFNIKVSFYIFI